MNDSDNGFVRVDHSFNSNEQLFVRYFLNDGRLLNQSPLNDGFDLPSAFKNNFYRDQSVASTLASVVNPTLVNEPRLQFARRSFDFPTVSTQPHLELSNTFTWKNFDPRLGMAYKIGTKKNVVVRGGFGLFHGMIPAPLLACQEPSCGKAAARAVSDAILDKVCPVAGTPKQCIEKLEEYREAGCTQMMLELWGDDRPQQARLFGEKVLPHFRKR